MFFPPLLYAYFITLFELLPPLRQPPRRHLLLPLIIDY